MALDPGRIRAVVFDMDDTLLNWRAAEHAAIGRLALLHFQPHNVPEAKVRDVYGGIMAENFASWKQERRWMYIQERLGLLVDRLGTAGKTPLDDLVAAFSGEAARSLAFLDGAEHALRVARAGGRKTALLTNGRSEVQRPKVQAFGLDRVVDFVGITGELGAWKPEPAAFHKVLDALGVRPEHALMVGDNEDFDITPAKALGMQTCWLHPDATAHPHADVIVRTPGEIVPLLQDPAAQR